MNLSDSKDTGKRANPPKRRLTYALHCLAGAVHLTVSKDTGKRTQSQKGRLTYALRYLTGAVQLTVPQHTDNIACITKGSPCTQKGGTPTPYNHLEPQRVPGDHITTYFIHLF